MKTIVALFLCALFSTAGASSAQARPPRAKQDAGVIRQIDHTERYLTLASLQEASKILHWDEQTQFWKDGSESSASALTKGTVVKCSYRVPLSGPASLTKVTIVAKAKKGHGARK